MFDGDPLQDLAAGVGMIMSFLSYGLSLEQFRIQCIQMGLTNENMIEDAYQQYQQYESQDIQLNSDEIETAEEMLSNDMDDASTIMQNVYNNKSFVQNMAAQYNTELSDNNNMYAMYRDLQKQGEYARSFYNDQANIQNYDLAFNQFTKAKNKAMSQVLSNYQAQKKLLAKEEAEQKAKEAADAKAAAKEKAIEDEPTIDKVASGLGININHIDPRY